MKRSTFGLSSRAALKRSGFKRPERKRIPPSMPARATRAAVMADCSSPNASAAKSEPRRNPHLLAMARGKPCLLRIRGVCMDNRETTVAAHSNLSYHGKAGARKADDCFSVWACSLCHAWLDVGRASADDKELAFLFALDEQRDHWRRIATSPTASPKDRAAALWGVTEGQPS